MAMKVKRRRGRTRISSKHQVTLPVDALREAGLAVGDELAVAADGPGRIVLTRPHDWIQEFAGDLTGVYEPGYLERLRDEWQ